MTHEQTAEAIALAIWEVTTGNGRDVEDGDDSHMQNCHAAVANAYNEDISEDIWHEIALYRMGLLRIFEVEADPHSGEWIGEATDTGETTTFTDWCAMTDNDDEHFDTYTFDHDAHADRAIILRWVE